MKNSRIVNILKTFSKKEVRELKKWLSSPAHNQRDDVFFLFEYLFKNNHLEKEKYLEKTLVYKKLFPQEPFNDAKMRQVIHFLLKTIEDFLIYKSVIEDEARMKIILARVYRKRKLDKSFKKVLKITETIQNQSPHKDTHFYRNKYLIQREKYSYMEDKKHVTAMNLQEVSDTLDVTFVANKLRQSCLMLAHQAVYKANYSIGLLVPVLEYVEQKKLYNIPAIAIYYYGYKAAIDFNNETYFQNLKMQINEYGSFFPKAELKDIFLMAINYCVRKMNAGNKNFIRESFELYREGLKREILIENNILSRWIFLNIVINGLKLKEFEWVKKFIEEYQSYLESKHRETFVLFCLARLYFEQKDYSQAMKLLIQIDYDGMLMNLAAKTILLKMYYELEELDALESLIESMRTYIQRKEVMGYHKANYKNIIRYTKKLVRINPYDKSEIQKLKSEIEEVKPLTEKPWLLEQLEKL